MTVFGMMPGLEARYNKSEVCPCNENKDLGLSLPGTKVTSEFGPATAMIKFDCVIP
jgi:hypothetical protein